MVDIRNSFTAADSIPIKLIKNYDLIKTIIEKKIIPPIHVQFIPTNKCNLACSFCSCSKDDRKTEMSFDDAQKIIEKLQKLGTKSVTVTGGGETLLYSEFPRLLSFFREAGIQIGLVTNGLLLDRYSYEDVTWCRISNSDERVLNQSYFNILSTTVENNPRVDWAFSHVVSSHPNIDEICRIIEFANLYNFTHVRLVADLLNYNKVDLDKVRSVLKERKVDDRRVIYQSRNIPSRGKDCYICYLKPIISAGCKVHVCCGVQYAFKKPSLNLSEKLCLGSAFDIDKIISKSNKPFDGRICYRCYYENYNTILRALLTETTHMDFV